MLKEIGFIEKLKNSNTQDVAFGELIALYKERLYWHIRKIVICHSDADDVLQNTFIKVFKNIQNFKGESKLYSWMYKIATNESLTYLNKKAKRNNIDSIELQSQLVESLHADAYFDGDEIQLKLQKSLVRLPQKQRLVFNMRYFDNMKYNDIAEVLDTSVGALKASYHHARKKIEADLIGKNEI